MDEENKQKIKILVIVVVVLTIISIVLSLLLKKDKDVEKVLNAKEYIIEKETDYTEKNGLLPIINLKGNDIEKINSEIMTKYYSVSYNEYDEFKYEYSVYKDILSVLVTVTYFDDSEYGVIEYYTYNINLDGNKVLSNKELYEYLNIDSKNIQKKITTKIDDYYQKDSLKTEIDFEEYLETINYKEENNKIVIKENTLYCYYVFNFTQSLMEYPGNINEIKIQELEK